MPWKSRQDQPHTRRNPARIRASPNWATPLMISFGQRPSRSNSVGDRRYRRRGIVARLALRVLLVGRSGRSPSPKHRTGAVGARRCISMLDTVTPRRNDSTTAHRRTSAICFPRYSCRQSQSRRRARRRGSGGFRWRSRQVRSGSGRIANACRNRRSPSRRRTYRLRLTPSPQSADPVERIASRRRY